MRSLGKIVLAALALLMGPPAAIAQDSTPAALPKAPVPYVKIRPPRPAAPAPRAAEPAAATPAPAPIRHPRGARLTSGQPVDPVQLEAFVDGWVADAMAREHVAGTSVSVVQNGQVVLKKGYGFADLASRRPVDPDRTLFRIGSISKTFTWILLMKEVEAGRIRLDRPINLYLPEKVRLTGKAREVTVGQLLNHTPGFEDRALGQLFENDPRRVRPLDLYLRQERPSRVRTPGLISSYSNYGAALAGEATAFGAGKTFERRVEDEIALPLGMNSTTFREPRPERRGLPAAMPERLRGDVAVGYGWRQAGFFPNDYEYIGQIAPAGSASSTAGDMSRYMLMLLNNGSLNGTTVFGPRAARAFRSPMRLTPPGINGWAHGFMTFDLPGGYRGYGHLGDTLAFHSGMIVIPELGLGVFVTTNSETGAGLADRLPAALVRQFYAPPATFPRAGSADLLEAADAFTGDYLSTRRAYGGLEGFVGLIIGGAEVGVTPGGRLLTHRMGAARAWVPEGPVSEGRFISTTGDERLAFHMVDGRAVSFRPDNNAETLQRAPFSERQSTLAFMAGLTAFTAVMTLAGLGLRNRRELRQNQIQARAALVQNIQAGLWLASFGLFGAWAAGASDLPSIMYGWPGPLVITASACALVAAALSLITIAAIPAIWQGGRRVDSWTAMRKVFFTTTVLIYTAFSVLLAMNGALEPWGR
ncbi:MAG: class A beta-lactamase-related serine hydrolase [Phenylobacterium sp.]|uniref:serine hydrolase domain-containing protein n=1 Tax=Phenylobacterium sp. TaxID=1871053 RepID=UPI001223DE59|nr:serine hydrolase domain-containing protein [Phenylobacterium sp.]TAJ74883.1 MAG: class A beta-lactamase-related serine hydrolase [Phenylobacterium sp.]